MKNPSEKTAGPGLDLSLSVTGVGLELFACIYHGVGWIGWKGGGVSESHKIAEVEDTFDGAGTSPQGESAVGSVGGN